MRRIYRHRELLWNLVSRDLKARYKVSVLGFFWSLLRPLLTMAVLAVVFGFLFRGDVVRDQRIYDVKFLYFLFAAYLPWSYFASGVSDGTVALMNNAPLLRKVAFPRELLPLSAVVANLINFILAMTVLLPFVFVLSGAHPSMNFLYFLPIVLVQTLLIAGVALLASIANVFYRDVSHIMEVLLMAWFYLTPIFYPLEFVKKELEGHGLLYCLYLSNPMTPLVAAYREALLHSSQIEGTTPALSGASLALGVGYSFAVAVGLYALSWHAFRRFGGRVADRV